MEKVNTQIINFTSFLPLIYSSNGLLKMKFVESAVFEIMGGGGGGLAQPPLYRRCGYQIPLYRKG